MGQRHRLEEMQERAVQVQGESLLNPDYLQVNECFSRQSETNRNSRAKLQSLTSPMKRRSIVASSVRKLKVRLSTPKVQFQP